ncbi:unnamed protein product (macronuclear) [Paramecium tetraurelia]|uniref:Uncharacterized protein n=1 Tax=Paramecium tetraurelia TaxID=5888 RepID=A0CFA9_PARTE|nr:uncharacterized protein GSPATT00037915001 [Paramecium tetraurelia]CAK69476.1 unnamed protein product [Paramecium tetraurelia]|eukprot:XP_001436873.1 hypothetical protein (macronuclear) [Paramecium tetraurelia strain d4-2]
MKNSSGSNRLINSKRTRTSLTINQDITLPANHARNSSIQTLELNKHEINQHQDKIYFSPRIGSPKKHAQQKSLSQTLLKSYASQKLLKTTQKDFQETNQIKDGDSYKMISPKVIFKDDKINVYFVKEVNKFIQQNEIRTQTQEQAIREQTIQEVTNSRVSIKGPIGSNQNQMSVRIQKGILSDPKHLFSLSSKKIKLEKVENLNTSVKFSLQRLLKLQQ